MFDVFDTKYLFSYLTFAKKTKIVGEIQQRILEDRMTDIYVSIELFQFI